MVLKLGQEKDSCVCRDGAMDFTCIFLTFMIQWQNAVNKVVFHKKRLTNPAACVIVIGRMEELRSFFYAQNYD